MIHIDSKRALILVVIGIGALNGPQSVLAEEADILDTLSSEQAVTVAMGYEKPVNLAPAVATVITAEDIKRMGATTIEEALESAYRVCAFQQSPQCLRHQGRVPLERCQTHRSVARACLGGSMVRMPPPVSSTSSRRPWRTFRIPSRIEVRIVRHL